MTRRLRALLCMCKCVCALLAGGRYALAGRCWAAFSKEEFPHCAALGPNDTYALHWKVINGSAIRFGLHVDNPDPDGWVGLGISEAGGMKGSDIAVLHRGDDDDGRWVVDDMWSTRFAEPTRDKQQDFTLINASFIPAPPSSPSGPAAASPPSAPSGLNAVLQRPLTTCDPNGQDLGIRPGMPQHIVWAYGRGWPAYHGPGTRGDTQLVLVPDDTAQTPGMSVDEIATAQTIDLRMPNITIPAAPTTYMCVVHEVPSDARYHIVRYEPLVGSQLVHHMILFACAKPQKVDGAVFECARMAGDCARFTIGWAPGVGLTNFPPEVGVAIGQGAIKQFALQVHYNNPTLVSGRTDASGFRLTYTPHLRPNDLGVLTLGQTALVLPPGRKKVEVAPSICPSACTSRLPGNLTMLWSGLHMHELGSTIITRHYRGGMELEPIGQRRAWDFNYQQSAVVPPSTRTLMPGDSLVTQCTYDTTTRTNVTLQGESTQDEMCYNFLVYYPAVEMEFCGTSADNTTAVCGAFGQIGQALQALKQPGPGGDVAGPAAAMKDKQLLGRLVQSGVIANATWPTGATPFRDNACPAPAASQQPVATPAVSSSQPEVEASSGP